MSDTSTSLCQINHSIFIFDDEMSSILLKVRKAEILINLFYDILTFSCFKEKRYLKRQK